MMVETREISIQTKLVPPYDKLLLKGPTQSLCEQVAARNKPTTDRGTKKGQLNSAGSVLKSLVSAGRKDEDKKVVSSAKGTAKKYKVSTLVTKTTTKRQQPAGSSVKTNTVKKQTALKTSGKENVIKKPRKSPRDAAAATNVRSPKASGLKPGGAKTSNAISGKSKILPGSKTKNISKPSKSAFPTKTKNLVVTKSPKSNDKTKVKGILKSDPSRMGQRDKPMPAKTASGASGGAKKERNVKFEVGKRAADTPKGRKTTEVNQSQAKKTPSSGAKRGAKKDKIKPAGSKPSASSKSRAASSRAAKGKPLKTTQESADDLKSLMAAKAYILGLIASLKPPVPPYSIALEQQIKQKNDLQERLRVAKETRKKSIRTRQEKSGARNREVQKRRRLLYNRKHRAVLQGYKMLRQRHHELCQKYVNGIRERCHRMYEATTRQAKELEELRHSKIQQIRDHNLLLRILSRNSAGDGVK